MKQPSCSRLRNLCLGTFDLSDHDPIKHISSHFGMMIQQRWMYISNLLLLGAFFINQRSEKDFNDISKKGSPFYSNLTFLTHRPKDAWRLCVRSSMVGRINFTIKARKSIKLSRRRKRDKDNHIMTIKGWNKQKT